MMTLSDYTQALEARASLQAQRKAEQNAETDEAQRRALEEARAYVAGLRIADVAFDAA